MALTEKLRRLITQSPEILNGGKRMKCKKCGQSKDWTEIIESGIKQRNHYVDGYIVEENTTYSNHDGVVICGGCGAKFEEYSL